MTKTHVAIIGGGVIGLSCAYYLTQSGITDVVIVDKGEIGRGASYANTGGLYLGLRDPASLIELKLFETSMKLFKQLPKRIRDKIEFEVNGTIRLLTSKRELAGAKKAVKGLRLFHPKLLDPNTVREMEPEISRKVIGGLYVKEAAHVNPQKLCNYLAEECEREGTAISENAKIKAVKYDGSRFHIQAKEDIEADFVVNAAGAHAPEICEYLGVKIPITPAKGYSVTFDPTRKILNSNLVVKDISIVQYSSGIVRSAGIVEHAGFDARIQRGLVQKVLKSSYEALRHLKTVKVKSLWTGFRPKTPDNLPIIGPPLRLKNFVIATGHFRSGVALSLATGKLVSQVIADNETRFAFSDLGPDRFGNTRP